jgi:hypothetical protein
MPRFVVLIHDSPVLHWDFMLEKEAILRTWRLARAPDETGPIDADALADHRLIYLDYEGPVSGNRGAVRRFDRGEYALIDETADRVEVELTGTMLRGRAVIERSGRGEAWELRFDPNHQDIVFDQTSPERAAGAWSCARQFTCRRCPSPG